MAGQPQVLEKMLERIKPRGMHQIDPDLAGFLQHICTKNKETISERLPELERILRQHSTNRTVDYDRHYLPYITHYMPKNYAKIQNVLLELLRKDLLPDRMQVLDIGAGPGTSAFAAANFFTHLAETEKELGITRNRKIKIISIEKYNNNRDAFRIMRDWYYSRNQFAQQNIEIADPLDSAAHQDIDLTSTFASQFDLAILSNVLTEMHDQFDRTIAKISQLVNPDGTIALIETSDKVGTNKLNRAKETLKSEGMTIYSPSAIWHPFCEFRDTTDYERSGWGCLGSCTLCAIEKPKMQQIRYEGIESSRKDIKYSFVMMRKDGIHLHGKKPGQDYVKMKELKPMGRTNVRLFKQRQKGAWNNPTTAKINNQEYSIYYACDGTCGRNSIYLLANTWHSMHINNNSDDGDILDIRNTLITTGNYSQMTEITADDKASITIEKNTL